LLKINGQVLTGPGRDIAGLFYRVALLIPASRMWNVDVVPGWSAAESNSRTVPRSCVW
jgi:hypothetical protein